MIKKNRLPPSWGHDITVSLEELSGYLKEKDFKDNKSVFPEIKIRLSYSCSPEDKKVGASESFEFEEWNTSQMLPESIKDAVEKYIESHQEELSEKAYERLCVYNDCINEPPET